MIEVKTINGRKYEICRMPFGMGNSDKSIRTTLGKVALIFDRSLGLSVYSGNSGLDAAMLLTKGALQILTRLDNQHTQFVIEAFGENTIIEGKTKLTPDIMDRWFSDHVEDFGPWLSACIEVNFVDFLSAFGTEGAKLESLLRVSGLLQSTNSPDSKEDESTSSQETSTSTSTESASNTD